MSEKLINTSFTTNLNGWDYDYYAQDGGWAKCTAYDGGSEVDTHDYLIFQDIVINNTSEISTATMSADIQYDVDIGASNWIKFRLKLRDPNGNWTTPKTSPQYGYGTGEIQNWANNVDVKSILQGGGDGTWKVGFMIEMNRDFTERHVIGWWDDLSLDIVFAYSVTTTETLNLTPVSIPQAGYVHTTTETLNLSAKTSSSSTIATDYGYYLGDSTGKVYHYHSDYLSDDGENILSDWQSKQTDFVDQVPEALDKFKTVDKAVLTYVDKSADVNTTIYISVDGGVSWYHSMRTLGTGDGTVKSATFYFSGDKPTGQYFDFKIEHSSTDKEFRWIELKVFGNILGPYFEIS